MPIHALSPIPLKFPNTFHLLQTKEVLTFSLSVTHMCNNAPATAKTTKRPLCDTVCAQPVSCLGERQPRSIIATCHSQVNSPPSMCSGKQSLFSLSSAGAVRLAARARPSERVARSHAQSEHFVCGETHEHVDQLV